MVHHALRLVLASNVIFSRLAHVDDDCLQPNSLGKPEQIVSASRDELAVRCTFVSQPLGSRPENLDGLEALQPGLDTSRKATLLAQRGEREPVQPIEEVTAPDVILFAGQERREKLVGLSGISDGDRTLANVKAMEEAGASINVPGYLCKRHVRVKARDGMNNLPFKHQQMVKDLQLHVVRQLADVETRVVAVALLFDPCATFDTSCSRPKNITLHLEI